MTALPSDAEPFETGRLPMFPDGWRLAPLGDLFDVQQGKAVSPDARKGFSPRPFLRTANVFWGRLDLTTVDEMDFSEAEDLKLALRPGDLLVCEGGEIGRTAIWSGELPGCLFQNHIHRLRARTSAVEPSFVMYWMQAAFLLLRSYGEVGNTTTIPNLSGARLRKLPIPLPLRAEQQAISRVLSSIHSAVEVQERIVAVLKELKAATMAKVLRQGLRGEPLKETEIGEIPESWDVERLGNLLDLRSGEARPGDLFPQPTESAPFPVYGGNGVMGFSSRYLTPREAIVIGRVGAYCGSVHVCPAKSWVTDNALYHRNALGERVSLHFLAELLAYLRLNRLHRKGAQPLITQGTVAALPVPVPQEDEQERIARVASVLTKRIQVAGQNLRVVRELFSSILQGLMTSQVRIPPKMIALRAAAERAEKRRRNGKSPDEQTIQEVVRRIVEAVAPDKIILFGSAARGEMGPDSDLDLMVVKACEDPREVEGVLYRRLIGVGVPKDILVVTPAHLEKHKDTIGYIYRPALREGRVIYAR
jgi:type I restriction enzyme S subunit